MSARPWDAPIYHPMLKHSRFASLAAKLRVERYVWAACATADSPVLADMRGFFAPVEAAEGSFALLGFAYELHGGDGYVFGCVGAA